MSSIPNTTSPATMSQKRKREDAPDALNKRTTTEGPRVGGNVYLHQGYVAQRRDMTESVAQRMPPPAHFPVNFSAGFSNESPMFAAGHTVSYDGPEYGYTPRTSEGMYAQPSYQLITTEMGSSLPPALWLYPTPGQSSTPAPHTMQDARSSHWQTNGDEHLDANLRAVLSPFLSKPSYTNQQSLLPDQQYPAVANQVRRAPAVQYIARNQKRPNPSHHTVTKAPEVPQQRQQPVAPRQMAVQQPPVFEGKLHAIDRLRGMIPATGKYTSQVSTWKLPPLYDQDVGHLQQFWAFQYMSAVQKEAQQVSIAWVPGISKDFVFNFEEEARTFQPKDIWNLRHLDLDSRCQEHANFVHLGLLLQSPGQNKKQFFSAWKVLRLRTDKLRGREQAFYQKFLEEPEQETQQERQRRTQEWARLTAEQALGTHIDPHTNQLVQDVQAGQKRTLEDDEEVEIQHPIKRTRVDDNRGAGPISVQEVAQGYQHAESPEHKVSEPTQEEETPYWKRRYPDDETRLPDHPFLNVSDYTIQADTLRYRCFHKRSKCSYANCSHRCCTDGYNEAGLKRAIHKALNIYKINVEKMINQGLLDKKHKWWPETFAKEKVKKSRQRPADFQGLAPHQTASTVAPRPHPQDAAQTALPTAALLPRGPTAEMLASKEQHRREDHQRRLTLHNQRTQRRREAHISSRQYSNIQYFDKYWNARRPLAEGEKLTDEEIRWKGVPRKPEQLKDEPLSAMPLLGLIAETSNEEPVAEEPVPEVPTAVEPVPEVEAGDNGLGDMINAALEDVETIQEHANQGDNGDGDHDSLFGDAESVPEDAIENDGLDLADMINAALEGIETVEEHSSQENDGDYDSLFRDAEL